MRTFGWLSFGSGLAVLLVGVAECSDNFGKIDWPSFAAPFTLGIALLVAAMVVNRLIRFWLIECFAIIGIFLFIAREDGELWIVAPLFIFFAFWTAFFADAWRKDCDERDALRG